MNRLNGTRSESLNPILIVWYIIGFVGLLAAERHGPSRQLCSNASIQKVRTKRWVSVSVSWMGSMVLIPWAHLGK